MELLKESCSEPLGRGLRACPLPRALYSLANGGLEEHPAMKPELAARAFVVKTLARMGLHLEPLRAGRGRPGGVGYTGAEYE